jgi:minor histocompatibility antigen H13
VFQEKINILLAVYFSLAGMFTLTSTISPFIFQFVRNPKRYGFKTTLPVLGEIDCLFNMAEVIAMIMAAVFSWQYVKTKHFLMNNVLSISFCVQTLERISIGSYKVGAVLLIGLFFYDIFWVFGTDVMVTVAKSFDGPIKLLFPRVLPTDTSKGEFSLLGLGDIVIPGLFVALLLRYDAFRMLQTSVNKYNYLTIDHAPFSKPFFNVSWHFHVKPRLLLTLGVCADKYYLLRGGIGSYCRRYVLLQSCPACVVVPGAGLFRRIFVYCFDQVRFVVK